MSSIMANAVEAVEDGKDVVVTTTIPMVVAKETQAVDKGIIMVPTVATNLIMTVVEASCTIAGIANLIEGHGQASILLSKGTHLKISDALYSPISKRSLLSFKDIQMNGFHIETMGEGNKEFLHIFELIQGNKKVLETIPTLSTGLYHT
ncbi:hypothetical protein N665_0472s0025 [Sinapis alba]|nr:hypothetical protein N665_0472s0025 [Sinapis alba]